MKIHEYQAKEILRRYGVATPEGRVTEKAAEAKAYGKAVKKYWYLPGTGKKAFGRAKKLRKELRQELRAWGRRYGS